jgi:hypothetical protein
MRTIETEPVSTSPFLFSAIYLASFGRIESAAFQATLLQSRSDACHPNLLELRRNRTGETMAIDGNWTITMTTPMGERTATLVLKAAGGTLTDTQAADGDSGDIFDGSVEGNDVAWKIEITNPMQLTLAYTGTVDGDSMSGDMGIGPMGSFPFTGVRV